MNKPEIYKGLRIIHNHLATLGYAPTVTKQGVKFEMIEGVWNEIILGHQDKRHIELTLLTSVAVPQHQNLDIFCLSLAPYLIPLKICSLTDTVTLQLDIKTEHKAIKLTLSEALVLMRHVTGAVYTEVFKLVDGKEDLFSSFEKALNSLKHSRVVTE